MICYKQILLAILITNLLFAQSKQNWVDSTYQSLTLEQKIGQLFMPMVFSQGNQNHYQKAISWQKSVSTRPIARLDFAYYRAVDD